MVMSPWSDPEVGISADGDVTAGDTGVSMTVVSVSVVEGSSVSEVDGFSDVVSSPESLLPQATSSEPTATAATTAQRVGCEARRVVMTTGDTLLTTPLNNSVAHPYAGARRQLCEISRG